MSGYTLDIAKCPLYRSVFISGLSFMRGSIFSIHLLWATIVQLSVCPHACSVILSL